MANGRLRGKGEIEHYYKNKIPMPYHWGNCLYLEWHSARNGRVVIETTDYELTVEPEAAWHISEEEEVAQLEGDKKGSCNRRFVTFHCHRPSRRYTPRS